MSMLKIEAKGPDNTLRLRQVKVLGYVDAPLMQKQPRAASIQQKNCEAETLRVFRLITSQVFGRLLENHVGEEAVASAAGSLGGLIGAVRCVHGNPKTAARRVLCGRRVIPHGVLGWLAGWAGWMAG